MAEPAAAPGDVYQGALTRYRETAKWVLTALGAAAVAAIAGFGLADYGKLDPGEDQLRFVVATAGVLLAVVGFLVCVHQALRLASESWTEPRDLFADQATLAAIEAKDPKDRTGIASTQLTVNDPANGMLGGYDSFEALSDAHVEALKYWGEEQLRVAVVDDQSSRQLAARWGARATLLSGIVGTATLVGSTRLLRAKFEEAALRLVVGGAIAGVGIIAFAWAVTAPAPDPTVEFIGPTPDRATLEVADGARDSLQGELGEDCDLDSVEVIVTGTDDKGVPSVVVTDDSCTPIALEVDETIGTVSP